MEEKNYLATKVPLNGDGLIISQYGSKRNI